MVKDSSQWEEQVSQIYIGLKSRSEQIQTETGSSLVNFLRSDHSTTDAIQDIERVIEDLLRSNETESKRGGVIGLQALITELGVSNEQSFQWYCQHLLRLVTASDFSLLVVVARAMGSLALVGGFYTQAYIDRVMMQAIEHLRHENLRLCSVMILAEIARSAPTFFQQHIGVFYTNIFIAVKDTHLQVRQHAVQALREALTLSARRDDSTYLTETCENAVKAIVATNTEERKHGGLLLLNELFRISCKVGERRLQEVERWLNPDNTHTRFFDVFTPFGRQILEKKFADICRDTMDICNGSTKNSFMIDALLLLVPRLASFEPKLFMKYWWENAMNFVLGLLKNEKQIYGYHALGLLVWAVSEKYIPPKYWTLCLDAVRTALESKKGHQQPMVLVCVNMITRACGQNQKVGSSLKEMLEPMLAGGLSKPLAATFSELSQQVPSLKKDIQGRLLNHIHQVFREPNKRAGESSNHNDVILAISILGTFDFSGQSLSQLVKYCAKSFLNFPNQKVRIAAARTVCTLLLPGNNCLPLTYRQNHDLSYDILRQLLIVGVTDPDFNIRYTILSSFDIRYNALLSPAENLDALFMALNDERFEIRERVVVLLGRISNHNPAYVMPTLRKVLIQLLSEIHHNNVNRSKEESAKLLGLLVSESPRFIRPYLESIMRCLISQIAKKDVHPSVSVSVMNAIGCQAQVTGAEMMAWFNDLMPLIIDFLRDPSLVKKEAALKTLYNIIESTGNVVKPYEDYPQLLDLLLHLLRTESSLKLRHEIIRVIGVIGAYDPFKYKELTTMLSQKVKNDPKTESPHPTATELVVSMDGQPLDELYSATAISCLLRLLNDSSLARFRQEAVKGLFMIVKILGTRSVPYINQVLPCCLKVLRKSDPSQRSFMLLNLGKMVAVIGTHCRPQLPDLVEAVREASITHLPDAMQLLSNLASGLGSELRPFVAELVPLRLLSEGTSEQKECICNALTSLGGLLDFHLHLVLPPLCSLLRDFTTTKPCRKAALEALYKMVADDVDISNFASPLIHALVIVMEMDSEYHSNCIIAFTFIANQLRGRFLLFEQQVMNMIEKYKIPHEELTRVIDNIRSPAPYQRYMPDEDKVHAALQEALPEAEPKKPSVNPDVLRRVWNPIPRSADWQQWLSRLTLQLLLCSSSGVLRACWSLAQQYPLLGNQLFNVAFLSCWTELGESTQIEFSGVIQEALYVEDAPELTQTLLDLVEFMEHSVVGKLDISLSVLAECAFRSRAYAKALHYKELELKTSKTNTNEAYRYLIKINEHLQNEEAARGIYVCFPKQDEQLMLEETGRWEEALSLYNMCQNNYGDIKNIQKQSDREKLKDVAVGRLRCLKALGEWEVLNNDASTVWQQYDDRRHEVARIAAWGALAVNDLNNLKRYADEMQNGEGALLRAIHAAGNNKFKSVEEYLKTARVVIDGELVTSLRESYSRAYSSLVHVQQLVEVDEVNLYRLIPERRELIQNIWKKRLVDGCRENVDYWQMIISIHSLVLSPAEDYKMWLKLASMARKQGRNSFALHTLFKVVDVSRQTDFDNIIQRAYKPHVNYNYAKLLWEMGSNSSANKLEAFKVLHELLPHMNSHDNHCYDNELLSKIHLRLGEWLPQLSGFQVKERFTKVHSVLRYLELSTTYGPNLVKAWQALARANADQLQELGGVDPFSGNLLKRENEELISWHCKTAIIGFQKAITLSSKQRKSTLQDTLRLLTVWFDYGQCTLEVQETLAEVVKSIDVTIWMQVIPQLIARLESRKINVAKIIANLLTEIGKTHPQAIIFPLIVASNQPVSAKNQSTQTSKTKAKELLEILRDKSPDIVSEARMLSTELIRVAILWHELWYEALEEASRLYFGDHNIKGMLNILEPLHEKIDMGTVTLNESSFNYTYGRELMEAQEWCRKFLKSNSSRDLAQAWDLYYHVFRKISKELPSLSSLELSNVSPKLLNSYNLQLAVPGTYDPNLDKPITIEKVQQTLNVITSKQRPRKLTMIGSNGHEYEFLLKGHEDLRQDERVMQLFGLVNTLLSANRQELPRIKQYAVVPLSTNSGLIGWVPHCDTIHALIKDHREKKKQPLNAEHKTMTRLVPDFDHLPRMAKVEVFERALEESSGDDLAKILWQRSPSSEVWYERRLTYIRSLALMSMVGYILGLGDRHPSNIMLERTTGAVLHIDFGDCFEVAMQREKFPEKIPFRLTRMLIAAMEATGIEGNYRLTCIAALSLLRQHKISLLAVLEAFVYDPLFNWHLGESKKSSGESNDQPHSGDDFHPQAALNQRAVEVIERVKAKLHGTDFDPKKTLNTNEQVERLIKQATSHANLCQCYIGWCPFW